MTSTSGLASFGVLCFRGSAPRIQDAETIRVIRGGKGGGERGGGGGGSQKPAAITSTQNTFLVGFEDLV